MLSMNRRAGLARLLLSLSNRLGEQSALIRLSATPWSSECVGRARVAPACEGREVYTRFLGVDGRDDCCSKGLFGAREIDASLLFDCDEKVQLEAGPQASAPSLVGSDNAWLFSTSYALAGGAVSGVLECSERPQ